MALGEALVISPLFVALISFKGFLFVFPSICFSLCLDLLLLIIFSLNTQVAQVWVMLCKCFPEEDFFTLSSEIFFFKTHDMAPGSCIASQLKGEQVDTSMVFVLNKSPGAAARIRKFS